MLVDTTSVFIIAFIAKPIELGLAVVTALCVARDAVRCALAAAG